MNNNQWNYNNQQSNQWNGNQQANQWNGNQQANQWNGNQQVYGQQAYNQQGYGQPPLGQQVDLQEQYNQQQMYGAPVPKKKRGPGIFIIILLVILAITGAVFGVSKMIGKDKEDATVTIEPIVEDIEDTVIEPETPEGMVEIPEEEVVTEEVQLDEMVEGKIPTPEELGNVLKSLEFSQVYIHDDNVTAYTLDVDYQIFDNKMAAEIRYEAILDTINDKVNAKHDNTENHEAYEILNKTDRDGYQIVQVLVTKHKADCSLHTLASYPYSVEVYILKGNTILDYYYDMDEDKVQGSTPRSLEKALEKIEYVTVDKIEFDEEETETVTEVATEEENTENTLEDAVTDAQEATDKINEALDNVEEITN